MSKILAVILPLSFISFLNFHEYKYGWILGSLTASCIGASMYYLLTYEDFKNFLREYFGDENEMD